jgi:adenylate kinase
MGAPGSGKGSQAEILSAQLGIPAISTGDLFRQHVRDRTPLGLEVGEILRRGEYVPDSITNQMVHERIARADALDGFVLDGYPRTPDQVRVLDSMLAEFAATIDAVVFLVVPATSLVPRLLARGEADGRTDDTEDSIRHRLSVFESTTAPLLDLYHQRALAAEIDGLGTFTEVSERIMQALSERVTRSR